MPENISIQVIKDTATDAVKSLEKALAERNVKRAVGTACARLVQGHLNALGPNKRGWPSTDFYAGAARGTSWDYSENGIVIQVENELHPGAIRQRYHGGTISMKDKLLTIPARAEFYGHRAGEFDNLKFVMFGRAKALVVGDGGTGTVDFSTGRSRNVKGAGVRSAGVVAYWLVESVTQDADPDVLPTQEALADTAIEAVTELVAKQTRQK